MEIKFAKLKTAELDGKRYNEVDKDTADRMRAAGLKGHDIYNRAECWNFLGSLSSDERAMEGLKNLLSEEEEKKPLLFHLTDNIGSLKSYKGQRFGGNDWNGVLEDHGNAWLVVCTNSYR